MKLNGSQREKVDEALLDAFPTTGDLQRLVRFELDQRLDEITSQGSHRDRVFELVNWAEAHETLEALLRGARRAKPGNRQIQDVVRELFPEGADPSAEPPSGVGLALPRLVPLPNRKSQFSVFLILLGVVALFTLVFASGLLRFGLEGPFIYILYVFAGMLAAALCFGLLDSTGTVEGTPYGLHIKLGGAIVALVLVAGGGGLYEQTARARPFSVRVLLYETSPAAPTPVSGSLILTLGAKTETVSIDGQGSVLFQDIERKWANQPAKVRLQAAGYELAAGKDAITLTPESTAELQVRKKSPFVSPEEANVELSLTDAQSWKLPARSFRTLDLQLTAVSKSSGDVPIAAKGAFRITRNGVPVKEIPLEVSGGLVQSGAVLAAGSPLKLTATGQLGQDEVELMNATFDAEVALRYEGSADREFTTDTFPFSQSTIRFMGN